MCDYMLKTRKQSGLIDPNSSGMNQPVCFVKLKQVTYPPEELARRPLPTGMCQSSCVACGFLVAGRSRWCGRMPAGGSTDGLGGGPPNPISGPCCKHTHQSREQHNYYEPECTGSHVSSGETIRRYVNNQEDTCDTALTQGFHAVWRSLL